MIRYLLDTDVVSQAGKAPPNVAVTAWLDSVDDHALAIGGVTLRERWEGAEKARQAGAPQAAAIAADVERMAAAFRGRILPVDARVTRYWAALLVPDQSRADDKCQVAIASVVGLTLVSLNWRHVQGLGVPVLNPGRRPAKLYPA
ncbi:plasmid stabilization protein [Methylobacterium organophilum]|uniref:plasmid stabilization protein n=1 Tax=Methylobacterium organophilum TaxID=410 RepID=UPI001F128C82|nr:plasmid stabilization protein [Methylobacterium organophilum]UMY17496.1 plasmid stabilization protein [Methylobacterium organophilum]